MLLIGGHCFSVEAQDFFFLRDNILDYANNIFLLLEYFLVMWDRISETLQFVSEVLHFLVSIVLTLESVQHITRWY